MPYSSPEKQKRHRKQHRRTVSHSKIVYEALVSCAIRENKSVAHFVEDALRKAGYAIPETPTHTSLDGVHRQMRAKLAKKRAREEAARDAQLSFDEPRHSES